MKGNNYSNSAENKGLKITAALLIGAAAGAAASSVLLFLCAAVIVKLGSVPLGAFGLISSLISAAGAFIAGYSAVRLYGSRGLLMGAFSGLILFTVILASGMISSSGAEAPQALLRLMICMSGGAAGGIVRVNKRSRVKKF